jgi:N-acetylmuramoyl-L-alanine amidase
VVAAEPGLGIGVAGPLVADVQALLARYGYGIEPTGVIDGKTEFVVTAFQRHFRPERVDGRIDQSTITTLERLLAALPHPRPGSPPLDGEGLGVG